MHSVFRTSSAKSRDRTDAVCPNRLECLRDLDLLQDPRELREIVTTAVDQAKENNKSIDVENTLYEDSLGIFWRFRFQREQCHALQQGDASALWRLLTSMLQIHTVFMQTDDNPETIGAFYRDKALLIQQLSPLLQSGDDFFASLQLQTHTRVQTEQQDAFAQCLQWSCECIIQMCSFKSNLNESTFM